MVVLEVPAKQVNHARDLTIAILCEDQGYGPDRGHSQGQGQCNGQNQSLDQGQGHC